MCREKRRGGIAPGWKVAHKNQVTMDNRQENLCLVREQDLVPAEAMEMREASSRKNAESSLYWMTVQQLMNDPHEQVRDACRLATSLAPVIEEKEKNREKQQPQNRMTASILKQDLNT